MPNLPERKNIRLQNYDYRTPGAYFVTINVNHQIPLLGRMADDRVVLTPAG